MAARAENADAALDRLFAPKPSIFDRFGHGLDGLVLFQKVMRAYRVSEAKVTMPFFNEKKEKALIRHPINGRTQATVLRKYVEQVKRHGVVQGVRGEPWIVEALPGEPKLLLTWGTLTNAVYISFTDDPLNPQVALTVQQGLKDCVVFRRDTPDDVLRWLRDYHNKFHSGSSQSFAELLDEAVLVESGWLVHKELNHITARSGTGEASYEKLYAAWLDKNWSDMFKTYSVFASAKAFRHLLDGNGYYTDFKKWVGESCDFLDPRLTSEGALKCLHKLSTLIDSKFVLTPHYKRDIMFAAMNYCVLTSKQT